jgi:hypothetical protein
MLKATQTELEARADAPHSRWEICDCCLPRPFSRSSPVGRQPSFWNAVEGSTRTFGAEEAAFGATAPPFAALQPAPVGFAPVIVADSPALFAEFRGKYFYTGVARQLRWLQCAGFSRPLRRPCVHSGTDPGQGDMEEFHGFTPAVEGGIRLHSL